MSTFQTMRNPEPYVLTAAERNRARTLAIDGRPLLLADQPRLVALCLELNDTVAQMTAHMKQHMAECTHGRIPESVTVES